MLVLAGAHEFRSSVEDAFPITLLFPFTSSPSSQGKIGLTRALVSFDDLQGYIHVVSTVLLSGVMCRPSPGPMTKGCGANYCVF
jgi:hypothetical protein